MGRLGNDASDAQRAVWDRVEELWRLAVAKDAEAIEAALHPRYAGWEVGGAAPHDREYAVRSVTGPGEIVRYSLEPHRVEVYDERVGVAHYSYVADVAEGGDAAESRVTGRWTEVYLNSRGTWLLISVCGGPTGSGNDAGPPTSPAP